MTTQAAISSKIYHLQLDAVLHLIARPVLLTVMHKSTQSTLNFKKYATPRDTQR